MDLVNQQSKDSNSPSASTSMIDKMVGEHSTLLLTLVITLQPTLPTYFPEGEES